MLDKKNLFELAKITAKANPSAPVSYSFGEEKFDYAALNETLRAELNEIAGTPALYRENKNTVFALIEQVVTDVLPERARAQYGEFAEISHWNDGDRPYFVIKITEASRKRAKRFITKAGIAGRYEVFKLDGRTYELKTSAWGTAAQISFEEFLTGRVNFADMLAIVMEGLDEALYIEIERALKGAISELPATNKASIADFNEARMDELLAVADAYGQSTIYCTFEFAAKMVPATGWISDRMKDMMWENGYLANYKGHRVVVMKQFLEKVVTAEGAINYVKVIDPATAWIIPTGAEKPIKVAFEGTTHTREVPSQDDWSHHIDVYMKMGVGAVVNENLCVYEMTSLKDSVITGTSSDEEP